jgi:DnaJ-class molecular chaperone
MSDYFKILGLEDYTLDEAQIKKKYRDLAKKCHPDKGGDPEEFKKINEAYNFLAENPRRNEYLDFIKNGGNHEDFNKSNNQQGINPEDLINMFFGMSTKKRNPVPIINIMVEYSIRDLLAKVPKDVSYKRLNENGIEEEKKLKITLNTLQENMVLSGKGHQNNKEFKGDVVLRFILRDTSGYQIENNNLILTRQINLLEALTEYNLIYKHPDGREINIIHKNGINNRVLQLQGFGLNMVRNIGMNMRIEQQGDLIIKLEIEKPTNDVIEVLKKYYQN